MAYLDKLWQETPLVRSVHISTLLGCDAYLKLENLHPPQSFKYRGISHFAQHALRTHGPDTHLVIASGGNAGLAAACAASVLKLKCTVFLPQGVSQPTIDFMRKEGAEVVIGGDCYLQALQRAEAATAWRRVMVPAYDDPLVWEGHASIVHEVRSQLPEGVKPDAIFCSVGGAGLAGGVMEGCKAVGWDDEDHKILVELACAVTLSPAYNPALFRKVVPQTDQRTTVVFIVCGGFKISLAELEEYKSIVASEVAAGKGWDVAYNGESFTVPM